MTPRADRALPGDIIMILSSLFFFAYVVHVLLNAYVAFHAA